MTKKSEAKKSVAKKTVAKTTKPVKQKMFYDKLTKKTLKKAVELNMPVLMVGETGAGKTSFIRDLAESRGIKLTRINLTGQTGVDEVLGKWIVKGKEMVWIDGPLVTAMKEGEFIVFDEINMALPEILSALHSLLDDDRFIMLKEKENEKIVCHERFRFFATMNPTTEYAGTKELNKAFLSRFPFVLNIEYSSREAQIIADRTGIDLDDAKRLVMAAKDVRRNKDKGRDIYYTCSTRDLIYAAQLMTQGFDIAEALHLAIFNKIDDNTEREAVKKLFEFVTGETIILKTESGDIEVKSVGEITEMLDKYIRQEKELNDRIEALQKDIKFMREEANKMRTKYEDKMKEVRDKYVAIKTELSGLESAKEGMKELMVKLKIPATTINEVLGKGTVDEKKAC
jgi:MoxR-like ATPase